MIRYFYLTAHYKKPLDLTEKAIEDARKSMQKLSSALEKVLNTVPQRSEEILRHLADDMNTPAAIAHLQSLASKVQQGDLTPYGAQMLWSLNLLGLKPLIKNSAIPDNVTELAEKRLEAKKNKDWSLADSLRNLIEEEGYKILDDANSYKVEKIR